MRIAFSAGEASGDAYAGALLAEISRSSSPSDGWSPFGIGGPLLRAAGAAIVADSSTWGAIGIAASLRAIPRVFGGFWQMKRRLARGEPGLFIPIDYGFVNLRLARHARNKGWKVLYFSPPGSWRRDRQGPDLPRCSDVIVTPFSWSAEMLQKMGADARWYGHPIRQLIRDSGALGSTKLDDHIAALPGSREFEVRLNLPVIAEALADEPVKIEFAVSANLDVDVLRERWRKLAPGRGQDIFTKGDTYGALARSRAAVVCSGTATIEAALCGCPQVVIYRLSRLAELEAKLLRFNVKWISQPNILLERPAVPELIQGDATPCAIRDHLRELRTDGSVRETQLGCYREIQGLLGEEDAITKTADLARRMLAGGEVQKDIPA